MKKTVQQAFHVLYAATLVVTKCRVLWLEHVRCFTRRAKHSFQVTRILHITWLWDSQLSNNSSTLVQGRIQVDMVSKFLIIPNTDIYNFQYSVRHVKQSVIPRACSMCVYWYILWCVHMYIYIYVHMLGTFCMSHSFLYMSSLPPERPSRHTVIGVSRAS